MPSQVSDEQLGDAVLHSIRDGSYPNDEAVISAELPSSALNVLAQNIEEAQANVKASIRALSKETAPDIDGWIAQAKQLRNDIEESEKSSHDIVTQANEGENLRGRRQDTSAKFDLLQEELAFNTSLNSTLQQIHGIRRTLDLVQEAALADRLADAVALLDEAEQELGSLRALDSTRISSLVGAKIDDLRNAVVETLTDCWNALLHTDTRALTVSIRHEVPRSSSVDIYSVVNSLAQLDLLQSRISAFYKALNQIILTPRLNPRADGTVGSIMIDGNDIRISGRSSDVATQTLFADLHSIVKYLNTRLPPSISKPLSEVLLPSLIPTLISGWLSSSVPTDLEGISEFQTVLGLTYEFSKLLQTHAWRGGSDLVEWADRAPKVWLTRRREKSLERVRELLMKGLGVPKTVERIETQTLSRGDNMFRGAGEDNDWNADWSDDENGKSSETRSPPTSATQINREEEDGSAWGLDENDDEDEKKFDRDFKIEADDDADAWGWGDDNADGETKSPSKPPKTNGGSDDVSRTKRELTLRETYTITALPEQIIEIIMSVVNDAESLTQSSYATSPIAPAAAGLYTVPGLILSMYRASAPSYYSHSPIANMYLYNDSLWIAEQLRQAPKNGSSIFEALSSQVIGKLHLESDISSLELFGKRAYGKEMESQRTILGDLLDGAQGFSNCTERPFAQECDIAISSVIDRLRNVNNQWKDVLSHSALLQSTGSLLSTIINKITIDVIDMSDISEPESQRLASFCNRIASLEDLFMPDQSAETTENSEQPMALTAVYTPNWLRFQYLSNILESSLVDIKYLWTEGELRLEFSVEELIDLIEALFADSEHRRRAIADIRRSSVRA